MRVVKVCELLIPSSLRLGIEGPEESAGDGLALTTTRTLNRRTPVSDYRNKGRPRRQERVLAMIASG
ncbi:hypothetical protein D9M71_822130 [compost metagenome]